MISNFAINIYSHIHRYTCNSHARHIFFVAYRDHYREIQLPKSWDQLTMGCPPPINTFTTHLHLRLKKTLQIRDIKSVRDKRLECLLWNSLLMERSRSWSLGWADGRIGWNWEDGWEKIMIKTHYMKFSDTIYIYIYIVLFYK